MVAPISLVLSLNLAVPLASLAGTPVVRDYDTPYFEAARRAIRDRSADPSDRIAAMRELVERNATAARELIAEALKDQNAQIQRRAAEWLARYGDRRGLDWEAQCVANIACNEIRSSAVRMLGNSREERYAPLIRAEVERILRVGIRAGKWEGSADNRAMLRNGTIALARIGRPEDRDLVLDAVRLRPDSDFLEALGYVDDRRSREILWHPKSHACGSPSF